jgi:hypothetical protein
MAVFLLVLALIVALAFLYALALRPWLKKQGWADGFFTLVEPIEIALFKKSETILMGRLLWVGGLFVTAYDAVAVFISSLDMTPLTTRALDALHVPPDMRGLTVTALIALVGRAITWLRARTTKPLELVAVPDAQVTPAAAQAMQRAETAKDQAVTAVAKTNP